MIEGKGLGGKRVCRTNISLTNEMDNKLSRLAVSCGLKKTTLAALLVERCLDDPVIVGELQREYNLHSAYKVLPIKSNGAIIYKLKE